MTSHGFVYCGLWLLFCSWPELKHLHTINAHPANCICIEFDKSGKLVIIVTQNFIFPDTSRYFALGSADALTSLWDASEYVCLRTYSRLE